ncbi:hypothetical protein ACFLSJ_01030 [Verrucomicrobiota bacterium]
MKMENEFDVPKGTRELADLSEYKGVDANKVSNPALAQILRDAKDEIQKLGGIVYKPGEANEAENADVRHSDGYYVKHLDNPNG